MVAERFKLLERVYDQGGKRRESSQFRTFEIGRSQIWLHELLPLAYDTKIKILKVAFSVDLLSTLNGCDLWTTYQHKSSESFEAVLL
jgi:hypothetical protein